MFLKSGMRDSRLGSLRYFTSSWGKPGAATTVHFGPSPRLFETHDRIRQWCAGHGHRPAGISWEIYGHWDESWNANPSKIRTDVFYLLQD